jgi:uncharacterized membrane protein YedE/YeeE
MSTHAQTVASTLSDTSPPDTLANTTGRKPIAQENLLLTLLLAAAAVGVFAFVGTKQGLLLLIGAALGITLFQADFGFTEGFTALIRDGRTRKMRAQMLMLMTASLVMLPFFARGEFLGTELSGKVIAINVSVMTGGFLFGMGMQLGGGCASGTLYDLGSGAARMGITLSAFIFGSLIGTFHVPWWKELPSLGKVPMVADYGLAAAIGTNLAIAGGLWLAFLAFEKHKRGNTEPLLESASPKIDLTESANSTSTATARQEAVQPKAVPTSGLSGLMAYRWPLVAGAVMLALLNMVTLWVKGKPWGITSGFALWGAQIYELFGGDLSGFEYWASEKKQLSLDTSILKHSTSIMNIGLIMGVFWAARVSQKMKFNFHISPKIVSRLLIGGFLMGYGARLASGCNIGAYFSSIASGSMHGWAWFVIAFVGNMVGLRLKTTVFSDN